jgi:hypothetical protein
MTKPTEEELLKIAATFDEAGNVSRKIIDFLMDEAVPMHTAVMASGMAFASGCRTLDMSLPQAIDSVRLFYKDCGHETH